MEGNTFVISDLGLAFQDGALDMTMHVDANWASNPTDWKSISGLLCFYWQRGSFMGKQKTK